MCREGTLPCQVTGAEIVANVPVGLAYVDADDLVSGGNQVRTGGGADTPGTAGDEDLLLCSRTHSHGLEDRG
jgi:hypothetical protein